MPSPVSGPAASDVGPAVYLALARQMMLTSRRWRSRFNDKMKAIGQTHARYKVLYWIHDSGNEIGQRDLAERMGIEEPTLARLLDALEGQRLLVRRPSPTDRRAKLVSMTDAAMPVLETGNLQVAALIEEAFAFISPEDAQAGLKVLRDLHARLGELACGAKA